MDESTREVARLWALAQPTVSAFLGSMVPGLRDRDDILQDVAVAVIDGFGSYDESRPFVAWALGIARNQALLHLRRRRRDRLVFDSRALDQIEEAFASLRPEEVRMLDYLDECVRGLDARARRICELRYRDDLKPAAIAPLVGLSPNAVAKALQRLREALRDCVARRAAPGEA